MALELAFLNVASSTEDTSRNFHREIPAELDEYIASEGTVPADFAFDGAVISGSSSSVYHEEAWIEAVRNWCREAHERDLPLLGVCFGAQVLADALGGSVEAQPTRELGYRQVEHCGDSPLFAGIDRRFTVFVSHGDDIVQLPLGARKLAENDVALHGFRLGSTFGILFHPEFDRTTAERVGGAYDGEPLRHGDAISTLTAAHAEEAREAGQVFENFVAFCRIHRNRQSGRDLSGTRR